MNRIKKLYAVSYKFFRTLHREAAMDSIRNVLAVLGAGTILGDFATMRLWLILPCALVAFLIWRIDYERHFRGESVEESCARELNGKFSSEAL